MARNIFTLIFIFFFIQTAFAQVRSIGNSPRETRPTPVNGAAVRVPTDTLWHSYFQWGSVAHPPFYIEDFGYMAGNNEFGDRQKAQVFLSNISLVVEECIVWFGAKEINSNNQASRVRVHVMNLGGTGVNAQGATTTAPNQILATAEIPATQIDTGWIDGSWNQVWNIVSFTSPPTVTGNFAVSVDFTTLAAGDTAALAHSTEGTGNQFGDRSWEQWDDGRWFSFGAPEQQGGWEADIALGIFPIVQSAAAIKADKEIAKIFYAYPNPMRGSGFVFVELLEPSTVSVEVLDITGKSFFVNQYQISAAGKSTIQVDVSSLPSGSYYYKLKVGESEFVKKIVVIN
jgi:hypothetical protein